MSDRKENENTILLLKPRKRKGTKFVKRKIVVQEQHLKDIWDLG